MNRLEALSELMESIHTSVESGHHVPCVDPDRGHWWLADDRDLIEAAVFQCSTCPVSDRCRAYVEAHPEPAGVWAGIKPSIRGGWS